MPVKIDILLVPSLVFYFTGDGSQGPSHPRQVLCTTELHHQPLIFLFSGCIMLDVVIPQAVRDCSSCVVETPPQSSYPSYLRTVSLHGLAAYPLVSVFELCSIAAVHQALSACSCEHWSHFWYRHTVMSLSAVPCLLLWSI